MHPKFMLFDQIDDKRFETIWIHQSNLIQEPRGELNVLIYDKDLSLLIHKIFLRYKYFELNWDIRGISSYHKCLITYVIWQKHLNWNRNLSSDTSDTCLGLTLVWPHDPCWHIKTGMRSHLERIIKFRFFLGANQS